MVGLDLELVARSCACFYAGLTDLNRLDLTSAGEISACLTPCKRSILDTLHIEDQSPPNGTPPFSQSVRNNDLWSLIEELALLYESWYDLARWRIDARSAAVFEHSQLNRRLLAHPSSVGGQPKLFRMAILIQLNLIAWDYRRLSSGDIRNSLESIIRVVSEGDINVTGSAAHFLSSLITDRSTAGIINHERLWNTTRMLRILDRCSSDLQRRLEMALLCFLTSETPNRVWSSWTPIRFAVDLSKDFSQRNIVG